MTYQVLIVDDEPHVVDSISMLLEGEEDYSLVLHKAYRAQQALEIMRSIRIDLLLTDIQMPGMDGLTLAREAKKLWPDCAAVVLTAYSDFEYAYEAIHQQVAGYILKTEEQSVILSRLRAVIEKLQDNLNHREWLRVKTPVPDADEALRQSLLIRLLHDAQADGARTKKILSQIGFAPDEGRLLPILAFCGANEAIPHALLKSALDHYLGDKACAMALAPLCADKFFVLVQMRGAEDYLGSLLESVQACLQETGRQEVSFILARALQPGEPPYPVRLALLRMAVQMQEAFVLCVVEKERSGTTGQVTVDFLKDYIGAHIYEDLSLVQLARVTGYNASYLSRVFSAKTHETLVRYIARRRMDAIRRLMLDSSLTLDQIMQRTNFSSRSYFNCFVKKETGLSPKKYRAQLGI